MWQANSTINDGDNAFMSRMLLIMFAPLITDDDSGESYASFNSIRQLLSALAPDLATLTLKVENREGKVEGKLDSCAITDCSKFFQLAVGKSRDRAAGNWGMLFYFQVIIIMMFNPCADDISEVFEFSITHLTKASYEMMNHANAIDQLIIYISRVKDMIGTNPNVPEHKCIHWHNFRTMCRPYGASSEVNYIAVRLEAVLNVISNQFSLNIKSQEVYDEMNNNDNVMMGKAFFYDASKNPYPIVKTILDEMTSVHEKVPLGEDELIDGTLKKQDCLFIKASYYNEVLKSIQTAGQRKIDYKTIKLVSNNPDFNGGEEYCFFDVLCNSMNNKEELVWFGWRVLSHCSFSAYCGATNQLMCGLREEPEMDEDVVIMNRKAGFPAVNKLYQPEYIITIYSTDFPDPDALPPGLKFCPWKFRNSMDDDEMPAKGTDDPDDFDPDNPFHLPSPPGSQLVSKLTPRSRESYKSQSESGVHSDYGQQQGGEKPIPPRDHHSPVRPEVSSILARGGGAEEAPAAVRRKPTSLELGVLSLSPHNALLYRTTPTPATPTTRTSASAEKEARRAHSGTTSTTGHSTRWRSLMRARPTSRPTTRMTSARCPSPPSRRRRTMGRTTRSPRTTPSPTSATSRTRMPSSGSPRRSCSAFRQTRGAQNISIKPTYLKLCSYHVKSSTCYAHSYEMSKPQYVCSCGFGPWDGNAQCPVAGPLCGVMSLYHREHLHVPL